MKGCRANSLPKGAASIIFLDEDAAHDHGISGRVAAQLRHAGERLAVVIAAGAATATTAAMSAAAMTAAARAAAMGQRHSINTSRIAWEEHEWASALAIQASSEVTNVNNVRFLHFLLKISGIEGCLRLYIPGFTHVLHRM